MGRLPCQLAKKNKSSILQALLTEWWKNTQTPPVVHIQRTSSYSYNHLFKAGMGERVRSAMSVWREKTTQEQEY